MITELSIKGFKCFDDIKIEPKGLTLLAGRNSAGKSTVIQAILALKQSGINPFRGAFIDIGEISELMNSYIGAESIEITAKDENEEESFVRVKGLEATATHIVPIKTEVVYCSAERVGVKDAYDKSPEDDESVGTDCRYAFSYFCKHNKDVIDEEFVYDQDSLLTLDGQVNYWLFEIVGCRMRASYLGKTSLVQVEYNNQKKGHEYNWVRPQNVGTGVTYIASIIIAAFSCHKNGILIVENPEIHLHPSAQSKFLEFLSFMSLCGAQVIIETHSDHIFNGVRKCVHNNAIGLENQSIYFFKDKENNCSEPVLVQLDDDGRIKNLEEGMFDQIQKDLDIILDW